MRVAVVGSAYSAHSNNSFREYCVTLSAAVVMTITLHLDDVEFVAVKV